MGDPPLRLLRAVRGIDLVELPRAEECCGFGGTFAVKNAEMSMAMLGDKVRGVLDTGAEVVCAADNSCLMHIGGALSRHAPGCARSTSRRCWRRELLGQRGPPAASRSAASPCDSQLRRNMAQGDADDPRQARGVVGGAARLAGAARGGPGDQGASLLPSTPTSRRSRPPWPPPAAWCTGRSDGDEACSIVAGDRPRPRVDEVVKIKSIATDEIELNEALAAAGVRAVETDLAELIIQLADDVRRTSSSRRSTRTAPRSATCSRASSDLPDLSDEPRGADRGRAAAPAAQVPAARAWAISGANFAVAETGTVCVVESEGNGRMCTTLPRGARHGDGHREAGAALAGHGGLPAAAAALVDRASG